MKIFSLLLGFFLIFTFTFISMAQDSYFGIGKSSVFIKPEPAQGNSAGVEYNLQGKKFVEDLSKECTISYDSNLDKVTVGDKVQMEQKIVPLSTGTEIIDFEKINYNYENPDVTLANFSYSMILESRTDSWAWFLNYNWNDFQTKLNTLGTQGFRIENIETYGRYGFNYGGTWTKDSQGWAWVLNYTDYNSFIALLNSWPNGATRYRPVDFAINLYGSQLYYGAVAKADNLGFGWIVNEGSSNNFITWINNQYNQSRRLVEIELYRDVNGNQMCAGISNDAGYAQQVSINLSWDQFQTQHNQFKDQGYRIVDFDKYYVKGNLLYAGLWNKDGIGAAWHLNELNDTNFQNSITSYINSGYKPIMVNAYDDAWTSVKDDDNYQIISFLLSQNYPNPFNSETKITYSLSNEDFTSLIVYDALGRQIISLVNKIQSAGTHTVQFDGRGLSSGVYFYRIESGNFAETKKMVLMK
jgi:hypothetical protein